MNELQLSLVHNADFSKVEDETYWREGAIKKVLRNVANNYLNLLYSKEVFLVLGDKSNSFKNKITILIKRIEKST